MNNAGQVSSRSRGSKGELCAYFCAIILMSFGSSIVILWLVLSVNSGQAIFSFLGIILFFTAGVLVTLGFGVCYYMNKKSSRSSNSQGPIVSGLAPPGPVSGFYVQSASQGMNQTGYPQSVQYPQPTAPLIRPVGAYPLQTHSQHDPRTSQSFDMAPPPSYDDVVKRKT